MKKLIFRKEAESDTARAYHWYEGKRQGLGDYFLLCIEEAVARIARRPGQYPEVLSPVRRAFIKRFPYAIYFIESEKLINVIAVLHHRQRPELIDGRI